MLSAYIFGFTDNNLHFVSCVCACVCSICTGCLPCLDFSITNLLVTQVHVLLEVTCFKSFTIFWAPNRQGFLSVLFTMVSSVWRTEPGTFSRHSVNICWINKGNCTRESPLFPLFILPPPSLIHQHSLVGHLYVCEDYKGICECLIYLVCYIIISFLCKKCCFLSNHPNNFAWFQ